MLCAAQSFMMQFSSPAEESFVRANSISISKTRAFSHLHSAAGLGMDMLLERRVSCLQWVLETMRQHPNMPLAIAAPTGMGMDPTADAAYMAFAAIAENMAWSYAQVCALEAALAFFHDFDVCTDTRFSLLLTNTFSSPALWSREVLRFSTTRSG